MRSSRSARASMRLAPLLLVLVLGAGALAGCFGESTSPVDVVAYVPLVDTAPGRTVQLAFFVESTDSFKQRLPVGVERLPHGWTFAAATPELELAGRETRALVVTLGLAPDAPFGPHTVRVKVGETGEDVILNVEAAPDARVERGGGARLDFVALSANGTVLATNVASLRNQTRIPLAEAPPEDAAPWNATGTLLAYLGDERPPPQPFAEAGYVALPDAWRARLLNATHDGGAARAGDAVALELAEGGGALLLVLETIAPTQAADEAGDKAPT